jgi:hypothetical protein
VSEDPWVKRERERQAKALRQLPIDDARNPDCPRNWSEDPRGGEYCLTCIDCGKSFCGMKGRGLCRTCSIIAGGRALQSLEQPLTEERVLLRMKDVDLSVLPAVIDAVQASIRRDYGPKVPALVREADGWMEVFVKLEKVIELEKDASYATPHMPTNPDDGEVL